MSSVFDSILASPKVVRRSLIATFAAYQACYLTPISYGEIGGQVEVTDERFQFVQYMKDYWFAFWPKQMGVKVQELATVNPHHWGYLLSSVADSAIEEMIAWVMPGVHHNTHPDVENQYGAIGQERERARINAGDIAEANWIHFGHLYRPRNIDYSVATTLFDTPMPAKTIHVVTSTSTSEIGVIGGERTPAANYGASIGRLGSPINFSCPPPRAQNHDDWE